MKKCTRCKQDKPLAEFSKGNHFHGKQWWCKKCSNVHRLIYMENDGREIQQLANRRWQKNNLEKIRVQRRKDKLKESCRRIYRAQRAIRGAKRKGDIVASETCEKCGSYKNIHAHHWSYDKEQWLNVLWLCRKCHLALHAAKRRKLKASPHA